MGLDNYTVTTPPTGYPVTLPEVKTWLGITTCTNDDLLLGLIASATAKAELFTNRVFITRSITGRFECLMCDYRYEKGPYFQVRRGPILLTTDVATVKVYVDDVLTTIEATEYNVKLTSGFSRVVFEEVNDSPDLISYPYEIAFTAGYGTASDVPDPIKMAIKNMVAYWYQQRGDCDGATELPVIAEGILKEYRILNTYG